MEDASMAADLPLCSGDICQCHANVKLDWPIGTMKPCQAEWSPAPEGFIHSMAISLPQPVSIP